VLPTRNWMPSATPTITELYATDSMHTITLSGSPLSTQHIYRNGSGRTYMTKKAKEAKQAYQWEAKAQWHHPPVDGDVIVNIILYFPDNRRRDWDNWHKLTMDALEGIVYHDDSQIQEAHVIKQIDKDKPRTEISIVTTTMCDCGKVCKSTQGLKHHKRIEHEED